jgi:hypothetical protein
MSRKVRTNICMKTARLTLGSKSSQTAIRRNTYSILISSGKDITAYPRYWMKPPRAGISSPPKASIVIADAVVWTDMFSQESKKANPWVLIGM